MQFIIDKLEYLETLLIVTGKTSIGTVKGIWKHKKEPTLGKLYHVELSIDKPKEVKVLVENKFPSVSLDNEVYYLRFDIDWLDMLNIEVRTDRKKKGDYISFSVNWDNLGIYPYEMY